MDRTHIGDYELDPDNQPMEGGQGFVYKAYDPFLKRTVAIKEPKRRFAGDTSFLKAFVREGQIVAQFDHPNILKMYTAGNADQNFESEDAELPYLVMEWGHESIHQQLRDRKRFGEGEVLEIGVKICQALEYAHTRPEKIIHRDIKPKNLLINEKNVLKVCDFGLATAYTKSDSYQSSPGLRGTPEYIAPEIWNFENADERSDIYSLGITLYQLLSGSPPFTDGERMNLGVMRSKHLAEPVPHLPDASQELNSIIQIATAKEKVNRYQSASEMLAALEYLLIPGKRLQTSESDALQKRLMVFIELEKEASLKRLEALQDIEKDIKEGPISPTEILNKLGNPGQSPFIDSPVPADIAGNESPIDDVMDGLHRAEERLRTVNQTEQDSLDDGERFRTEALAMIDEKNYLEAQGFIEMAIESDGHSSEAYLLSGVISEGLSDLDKAISDYTHAIELDGQNLSAFINRGDAYSNRAKTDNAQKGDLEYAIQDYSIALTLSDD